MAKKSNKEGDEVLTLCTKNNDAEKSIKSVVKEFLKGRRLDKISCKVRKELMIACFKRFGFKLTRTMVAEMCGVSRSTFYNWKRDDLQFVRDIHLAIEYAFENQHSNTFDKLTKLVDKGKESPVVLLKELREGYKLKCLKLVDGQSVSVLDEMEKELYGKKDKLGFNFSKSFSKLLNGSKNTRKSN